MTPPTHAQVEALIERLHKNCPNNGERHIGGGQLANCICDRCEAASALAALRDENAALRSKLREIYEVYAGSEGFVAETAPEGYQQRLIKQMADIAAGKD